MIGDCSTGSSGRRRATLFNSHLFLFVFLPLVMFAWWGAGLSLRSRLVAVTVASYVFYGWWDWRFTILMYISTILDHVAGARIAATEDEGSRWRWLMVSVVGNLALLGLFKYLGFFARTANFLAAGLGLGSPVPVLEIVLPVGISFYTFQTMSYTIDVYRRESAPPASFWHFAAYVSMFPQLVAGPIVRYSDIEARLGTIPDSPDWVEVRRGVQIFVLGLAKKLLLADALAGDVDRLLADPARLGLVTGWAAMLGYAFQIYFDFSGYSDMAVGLGRMIGFEFPANFDSPYQATDISDFWRRWHITFSTWLRDYLFIPLGGSHGSLALTLRNLGITMFLGGLWHGAAWTFVVWGLYHGVLLGVVHVWRRRGPFSLPAPLARSLTFLAVLLGWIFFRAPSFADGATVAAAMAGASGLGTASLLLEATLVGNVAFCAAISTFSRNSTQLSYGATRRELLLYTLLFVACVTRLGENSPFLYFQF